MNIKCPQCGGSVIFDPQTGKMKCLFCGSLADTNDFDTAPSSATESDNHSFTENDDCMEMKIYHCSSCGADLMVDGTGVSTFCSYCGSPSIIFDRVSKEVRPSKIIPFKITDEQALRCIKDRFGHGKYIPSKIRALTVDSVRAIYIPFWLYTAYIRKNMVITAHRQEDTLTYFRNASCTYSNVTMDASLRLSNDMSRRLEPYYMNELEDFDTAYLSGYFADKYDVPCDAMENEVHKRCRSFIETDILNTCPHANKIGSGSKEIANYQVSDEQEEYRLENVEYAFLPAYFVNIQYGNTKRLVIVNGQTGKVVGNLPFEKEEFMRKLAKNSIISCTVFSLFSILFFTVRPLMLLFILLLIIDAILLGTGISGYKKYKFGMLQLASKQMTSYANRMGD